MSEEKTETSALVIDPRAEGFREKADPQPMNPEKVFLFKCQCGGVHFRHAGYCELMLPYIKPGAEKSVAFDEQRVMVCVKCKRCFIRVAAENRTYDITDQIDLEAWEKTEREMHKATGPGGNC